MEDRGNQIIYSIHKCCHYFYGGGMDTWLHSIDTFTITGRAKEKKAMLLGSPNQDHQALAYNEESGKILV